MAKVTMREIAAVMGVSVMTVSNAFNRPDQLSADLRGRILARAEKMGYGGPDGSARSLRTGRANAYGVVFSEGLSYAFNDPFSVLWLSGLSQTLERAGASILLLPVPDDGKRHLDTVQRASVDGFAGLCASHPVLQAAESRGLPVVSTDGDDPVGRWVAIDDRAAGRALGEHLRRLGHRRVSVVVERLFVGQPALQDNSIEGFRRSLEQHGHRGAFETWSRVTGILEGLAEVRPSLVTAGWNSRESGQQVGAFLLDRRERPTAIVCISDVMALGVLDAMAERRLIPGRDVSVCGFDDLPDAARAGLTTIHQPIEEKGRLVGELLLDPDRPEPRIRLEHRLVVRASTGPA